MIPIFSTDYSLSGTSILTCDAPKDEIDNKSLSVYTIAKKHGLKQVYILDKTASGLRQALLNSKKVPCQLIYGIKFFIYNNSKEKTEERFDSESRVNVWMKNDAGYEDLLRLYNAINTDKDRFYYYSGGDFDLLNEFATDNLAFSIPFYNSFIHNNLLKNGKTIPQIIKFKPIFHLESHGLPFDDLIRGAVVKYCADNGYETVNSHQIYYYKNKDVKKLLTLQAMTDRHTWEKPELRHFHSELFSFESYLNLLEGKND